MKIVLIIDDDPVILELFSAYLTQEGMRTLTASSGKEGLASFDAETPDIVLCDLTMPKMNGLEVLAEVQKRSPLTPFVVISGSNDVALAVEALRLGAWDYLLKPLAGLELLPPLFDRLTERSHLLGEKERYQLRLEEQIRLRTGQLHRQLREKDLLLSEVHHRVKNNLQIIQVILNLQQEHSMDAQVKSVLAASQNRIHALAMVQEEMNDADHATLVNARSYASGLIHHLLMAHRLSSLVELTLDLDDLVLAPGQAFTCGLVVNELMVALAEGSPPTQTWSLSFSLKAAGPGQIQITVRESLGRWKSWAPSMGRTTLGWDLVAALASQTAGGLTWNPQNPGELTVRLA